MNALDQTAFDLTRALRKFTREPRVADFLAWESVQDPRPYRGIAWSWSALGIRFEPSDTLSDLRVRIDRFIIREEQKYGMDHHSYDANRLVALKQMIEVIEQYQEDRT